MTGDERPGETEPDDARPPRRGPERAEVGCRDRVGPGAPLRPDDEPVPRVPSVHRAPRESRGEGVDLVVPSPSFDHASRVPPSQLEVAFVAELDGEALERTPLPGDVALLARVLEERERPVDAGQMRRGSAGAGRHLAANHTRDEPGSDEQQASRHAGRDPAEHGRRDRVGHLGPTERGRPGLDEVDRLAGRAATGG